MNGWKQYDAWNTAIAHVLFPPVDLPVPVYLNLEDDELAQVAEIMGCAPDAAAESLGSAVRETLTLDEGPKDVFSSHVSRLRSWRSKSRSEKGPPSSPPPVLAVLALLSLTADSMRHGDGMAENNYYGRLVQLLGADGQRDRVSQGYRHVAEDFWQSLNWWLEQHGGLRGLPTAFALGHRFVGLPLSQALVRRSDRRRFIDFFQTYGLPPGAQVAPDEIVPLLENWIKRVPCPTSANLERLWRSAAARPRIAGAAAVALSVWDGTIPSHGPGGHGEGQSRALLSLEIGTFPKQRLKVGLLLHAPEPQRQRTAQITSTKDAVTVTLQPAGAGALSLGDEVALDTASLLEGVFEMTDSFTGATVTRRPRRAVGFKQDPLSQRWTEIDQVLLTDSIRIVAQSDLAERLTDVLHRIARPGWKRLADDFPNLPEGWVVFTDIEVMAHPREFVKSSGVDDLSFLIPLTARQVKIEGGFSLPGSATRKWHVADPPEIHAVSDSQDGVTVRLDALTENDDGQEAGDELLTQESPDGVLVIDLAELELETGTYRVSLLEGRDVVSAHHFVLTSGDQPDRANWSRIESVDYQVEGTLGILGVAGGPTLEGRAPGPQACGAVAWWDQVAAGSAGKISETVALPDPASCIYTGRHYEIIDTPLYNKKGNAAQSTVEGRCRDCGLVRRYSTNYYRNRAMKQRKDASLAKADSIASVDLSVLAPVRMLDESEAQRWDRFLDALFHVGGGPWSSFERVAMQVEPTGIFVDHAARLLESMGHINIRRDNENLRPNAWEVTVTRFDTSPGSRAAFVGYWPDLLSNATMVELEELGAEVLALPNDNGPTTWMAEIQQQEIAAAELAPVEQAGAEILGSLPRLSQVIDALPRRKLPYEGSITRWDALLASWVDARHMNDVGGYRVRRFGTLDLIRTPQDLEAETAAVCTVQLSKHVAAQLTQSPPMLAYDADARALRVPKGADLPGLIGRAMVSFSGMAPTVARRSLVYRDVPAWAADALYASFSS